MFLCVAANFEKGADANEIGVGGETIDCPKHCKGAW